MITYLQIEMPKSISIKYQMSFCGTNNYESFDNMNKKQMKELF